MRDTDQDGYYAERANIDHDAPMFPPRAGAFDPVAYRERLLAAETPEEKLAREQRAEKVWQDWEAFALTQRKVKP